MGIPFWKPSGCDCQTPTSKVEYVEKVVYKIPNPNKFRFKILREIKFKNKAVVVLIKYLDCTNYEGKKLLVYDNFKKFQLLKMSGAIDPHFTLDNYSPIARFSPDKRGMKLAYICARNL